MMTSKHWLIGFIGIALIVLSSVDWLQEFTDQPATNDAKDTSLPEYAMKIATITQYDAQGAKQYIINAATYQYFIDSEIGKLGKPVIVMHTEEGAKWRISSERGEIHPANNGQEEYVIMQGKVEVEQLLGLPLNLFTEHLTLYPQREFAETEDDVMIQQLTSNTHGQGMQAKLAEEYILLGTIKNSRGRTLINANNQGESR